MHFWSRSQIPQNVDYSSVSSVNEEEVLTSLKENKLGRASAARLNKKLIEHNIPKAISQIESYLQVLKVAYLKVSRPKRLRAKPKDCSKENFSLRGPVFDSRPLQTIARCLDYIDDNSLDVNSSASSASQVQPSAEAEGVDGERKMEELNVSEITPEEDCTELISKNDFERSDYLRLGAANDSKKVSKIVNEESFGESLGVLRAERSKGAVAELADTSQESLCRTEEGELERERLKFVRSIEEDLKRRLGSEFVVEKKLDTTTVNTTLKNTARFPLFNDEQSPNSNKEHIISVESKRPPIRINVRSGKLRKAMKGGRKTSQEPFTFRNNAEAMKTYSSYKNLVNFNEGNKERTRRDCSKKENEAVAVAKTAKTNTQRLNHDAKRISWVDLNRPRSKQHYTRSNATQIERLGKPVAKGSFCSTSRMQHTPIEEQQRKNNRVVRLKTKKPLHPASRTCRSYTILGNNAQMGSFVLTEDHDTPSFLRAKAGKSKALSPSDSTQTTLEYYMKNEKSGKPYIYKKANTGNDWSAVNAQDAVKLLAKEYQVAFGKFPKHASNLVDYWKEYVSLKSTVHLTF